MQYMAVFTGSPAAMEKSGWAKLDEATRQERERAGMSAWMAWGEKHKAAVVVEGGPLGKTKRVDRAGVADASNNIAGYIIVEADSHDAAARMFENHPHFTIFPGEAVEIMPCNPIPAM
jgi:hypothetical protein